MDMILLVLQRLKLLKNSLNFIDFVQMEAPKTLADIHPDEASTAINYQGFYKAL